MSVHRYRVRRWTEFTWSSSTSDPEPFVYNAAAIFERALRDRYPELECRCEPVRVDGLPQLVFSATVFAETTVDAKRRASYRFEKALTSSVSVEGRPRRIVPPWGKIEAKEF